MTSEPARSTRLSFDSRSLTSPRRARVARTRSVTTACERLEVSFIIVFAVVRAESPRASSWRAAPKPSSSGVELSPSSNEPSDNDAGERAEQRKTVMSDDDAVCAQQRNFSFETDEPSGTVLSFE